MRVLIVHEDPIHRQAIAEILSRLCFVHRIAQVSGIDQARTKLGTITQKFDWVLAQNDSALCLQLEQELATRRAHRDTCLVRIHQQSYLFRPRISGRRTDAVCQTPTTAQGMREAFANAYRHRMGARDEILWAAPDKLPFALEKLNSGRLGHWKTIRAFGSAEEFGCALDGNTDRVGAILLSPEWADKTVIQKLTRYKQLYKGSKVVLAALCKNRLEAWPVRTLCAEFAETKDKGPEFWSAFLNRLSHQLLEGWIISNCSFELRAALKAGNLSAARRIVSRLNRNSSKQFEHHRWSAEVNLRLGKIHPALREFLRAMELNPCHPRPYTALIPLLAGLGNVELYLEVVQSARTLCAENPPIMELLKQVPSFPL